MGKPELDEAVVSKGEAGIAPTQSDAVGTETQRPSVVKKVHRYVPVRAQVLKGSLMFDCPYLRLVDLSRASLSPSTRHHPKIASMMPIISQR